VAPDHLLAPQANNGDDDLPLLAWRPVSHEETPAKFRRGKGDPRDYAAEWRAFVDGHPQIAGFIAYEARIAMLGGAARVSVNALFEAARDRHHATLNQSWRAAAADWLIQGDPALARVIERRTRRTTK